MPERQEKYEEAEMMHRRALQSYGEILKLKIRSRVRQYGSSWCRGVRSGKVFRGVKRV